MAALGYLLQRGVLNRTLGKDILPPLLVTFGLSILIQNGLLELFTADSRKLSAGADRGREHPRRRRHPYRRDAARHLRRRRSSSWRACSSSSTARALGRAFRATSDDAEIARLMGLDNGHIYGLAMALSLAVVAIAGVFLAVRSNFDPSIGPARLIFGFEAVIIGGLGNLWGTLAGGIILGVAQNIGAQINPGWQLLAGHLAFLLVLAIRPKGLFPRIEG